MATRLGFSMRLLDASLLLGLMQHVEIVAELEHALGGPRWAMPFARLPGASFRRCWELGWIMA